MSQETAFFDVLQTTLDCVCSSMNAIAAEDPTAPGCPCLAYVSVGEPVVECCDENCDGPGGMLTVHRDNVYPSDNFPLALGTFEPCKAATWVVSLVVTATRCVPSLDEQGMAKGTPEEWTADARIQALDEYAILTALGCCLVDSPPANKRKRRVRILQSTPLVTEGGCAGIEVRALVEAGQVCNCPPEGS